MTEGIKTGTWDPSRVLEALGRIGYEPAAAILDIVDNSVSAKATEVRVDLKMEKSTPSGRGRSRTVVAEVSVVDNGIGMNEQGLDNAISLGSSTASYSDNTLSKFGMGLKSASASLGRCCTIVSRPSDGPAMAAVLDHDHVATVGEYVYELREASKPELAALDEVCSGGQGTLVRITKIVDNLPSPVDILESLKKRSGVTYFYALTGATTGYPQMNLVIDGEPVKAVDPLFESEIVNGKNGDLDERTWDGCSVRYIERRKPIQLTSDGTVAAHVTITQLPHPPTLAHHSDLPVQQCRDQYQVAAGNYGFYIYRNGRLIGWAESLGMVSRDVALYSFRGRLEITADADDVLNLDVTKSRIQLSEIADTQLRPLVGEARKKSRAAWTHAGDELKRHTDSSSRSKMNEQLDRVADLEEKEDRIDESVEPEQEQQRRKKRREQTTNKRRATEEEGERVRARAERVQYVDSLENNQLWERAHHPKHGLIVRVNRSHRMFREILEPQFENSQLVQAFDLMFFSLARGEYDLVYKGEEDESKVEALVDEYRERVGSQLSEIVRQLEMDQLFNS
jgi:hypothetical protein